MGHDHSEESLADGRREAGEGKNSLLMGYFISFPLVAQDQDTVLVLGMGQFKALHIRVHEQRLSLLPCHHGSHHKADPVHQICPLERAVDDTAALQKEGLTAYDGIQLEQGQLHVDGVLPREYIGDAQGLQVAEVARVGLLRQHLNDLRSIVAGVAVGVYDAIGLPAELAIGIEGDGTEAREIVCDEVHFHIHIMADGLILGQVGVPTACETSLHGHTAADEAVDLQLAVEAVVDLGGGGDLREGEKISCDLSVDGGQHVANDVGGRHGGLLWVDLGV